MSLLDTTLVGDLLPGGDLPLDASTGIDTTEIIDTLLSSLHASSRADLGYWTNSQLIEYMDEAVKRLSRLACVFVGRVVSTLTVTGQAAYSLPPQHVSTLNVSYLTTSLRPANMMELEARDNAFETTQGTPDHWYQHLQANNFGLAPVPDTSDQPLPLIYEGWPTALDGAGQQTMLAAPAPLKGYLAMCVLAAAYGQEGEMEMPDVAAHCRGRIQMYEQAFQQYYGKGL